MESTGTSVTSIKFYHTKQLKVSEDCNHREKTNSHVTFHEQCHSEREVTVKVCLLSYKSNEQIIMPPSEYNSGSAFELEPVLTTDY